MWFMTVLDEWRIDQLEILRQLYNACQSIGVPADGHIAVITRLYSSFPVEQVAPDAIPSFRLLFGKLATVQPYQTVAKFAHLWNLLEKCGPPVLLELVTDPAFPPVFGALILSSDKRSTRIVKALTKFIRPLIDTTPSIKQIITALLSSDLSKLLESSPASASEFVLATLDDLPPFFVHDFIAFIFHRLAAEVKYSTYKDRAAALLESSGEL
jgi:hypothetical protein